MANADVFNAFRYATEDLSTMIFEQAHYMSMWLNLIPKGTCKLNAGTRFVNFGVGNTEPLLNVGKWKTVALSRDRAGCQQNSSSVQDEDAFTTNQWQEVQFGQTELDYQPEYWQLMSPEVSRQQLMFSHNIDTFIESYVRKTGMRAQREWEMNYNFNYSIRCKQAVACKNFLNSWNSASNYSVTEVSTPDNASYSQTLKFGTTTGLKKAKGILSQEMMEYVAKYLQDVGATNPDEQGFIKWEDAGPIFSLYLDSVLSQVTLRLNPGLRQDYRYGDPATLIARVGATRVIGNWRHWINQREDRFVFTQGTAPNDVDGDGDAIGTYTYIQPFIDAAESGVASQVGAGNRKPVGTPVATKGSYAAINSDWLIAPIGSAKVLSPDVFTSELIPFKNSGGGLTFGGEDWLGNLKWVTGAYKFNDPATKSTNDPLDDVGRHFGTFGHAPSPNPMGIYNYGWMIFYDRTLLIGNSTKEVTTLSDV